MKRLMFLISIFINSMCQEYFLVGNKLFNEDKYDQAVEFYKKVPNKGFGVFYNMGVSYFKVGSYLDALIAFKKAEKIARYDQFEYLNTSLSLTYDKLNIPFKPNYLRKFLSKFSFVFLQFILIILSFMIFFLVYLRNSSTKLPNFSTPNLFFLLIILFIFFGITYFLKMRLSLKRVCIVKSSNNLESDLKAGPDDKFHNIDTIKFATECELKKEINNFVLITCDKKDSSPGVASNEVTTGWIKKSECIEI